MWKHGKSLTFGLILSLALFAGCAEDSITEADSPAAAPEPTSSLNSSGDAAAKTAGNYAVDITGVVNGDAFGAVYTIRKFVVKGDEVVAIGRLSDITGLSSTLTKRLRNFELEVPVTSITTIDLFDGGTTCDILHLELGPIDLELLGLIVHVDKIVIDIDADPSAGILGDLLCALADGFAQDLLGQVADLLNQLLGLLS